MRNPLPLYVGSGLLFALSIVCTICLVLTLFVGLLNLEVDPQPTPSLAGEVAPNPTTVSGATAPSAPPAVTDAPAAAAPPTTGGEVPPPVQAQPTVTIPETSTDVEQAPVTETDPNQAAVSQEPSPDESDDEDAGDVVVTENGGEQAEVPADPQPATEPTPVFAEARLVISNIDRVTEFVEIKNIGGTAQPLDGWEILSENGGESCLLEGVIPEGGTLRVWSRAADAAQGGFNCGYDDGIWDDQAEDAAILYNAAGQMVYQRR